MKKILLLSDTHSFIDDQILKFVKLADEVWHAGDIGSVEVIDTIKKLKPLKAVYGNIDNHLIRTEFQEDLKFTLEEVSVWITHIGGYPNRYDIRIKEEITKNPPKLFICGHSHILKVIYDNANAAIAYNTLIQNLNLNENMHVNALKRLRTRQQSFVFFMMIRMLKSTITKKEIMPLIHDMKKCGAYPLNSLAGDDYNGFIYVILTRLFNQRYLYYVLFVIINPFLKKIYK